jgi:hypothetical protein
VARSACPGVRPLYFFVSGGDTVVNGLPWSAPWTWWW